jgi:hypothetical protein
LKHALALPALPRQADGNEYMQQLARGGYMFEKLVKVYYPGEDMFVPKESHDEASARTLAKIKADPLFQQVDQLRRYRATHWMNFTGYSREKVVTPTPLGDAEAQAAKIQAKINELRKK